MKIGAKFEKRGEHTHLTTLDLSLQHEVEGVGRDVVVKDALEESAVVVLHQAAVHHDLQGTRGEGGSAQGLARYQREAAAK